MPVLEEIQPPQPDSLRIQRIRDLGYEPYPSANAVKPTLTFAELAGLAEGQSGTIAGRIIDVRDSEGTLALLLADHVASAPTLVSVPSSDTSLVTQLRPGDVVSCKIRRLAGAITADAIVPVVMALEPLAMPDSAVGRRRELQVFWNDDALATIRRSSQATAYIHGFLRSRGFLEVLMPTLVTNADVSPNLPFQTQSANGRKYVLRTTYPYSERLFYSLDKAYQIGPNFRDEPQGFERNPEFNMISIGQTFADYDTMMDLGEQLLAGLAREINGSTQLAFLGHTVDLGQPWSRITIAEALHTHTDVDIDDCFDLARLEEIVVAAGLELPDTPYAKHRSQIYHSMVLDVLLKREIYPKLQDPTFLTEFPFFFGGPGRATGDGGRFKMRAEGFISGVEVAETAAVLTDPAAIQSWHEAMRKAKQDIGWAQNPDLNYLDTVRRGLLCPGIIAFGIERMLMLVLGKDQIGDVMLYSNDL